MKYEDKDNIKIGDIIYSFLDNEFFVYKVTNINLAVREITVHIELENNDTGRGSHIIEIPLNEELNQFIYCKEFTTMDKNLEIAYENYCAKIEWEIERLKKHCDNLYTLKNQYIVKLDRELEPDNVFV